MQIEQRKSEIISGLIIETRQLLEGINQADEKTSLLQNRIVPFLEKCLQLFEDQQK